MGRLLPVFLSQLIMLVVGLIGLRWLQKLVLPSVYGTYILFLTFSQLGTLLTHSGLINHASRYWQRETGNSRHYILFLWKRSWQRIWLLIGLLMVFSLSLALYFRSWVWIWILPFLAFSNLMFVWLTLATMVLNAGSRWWSLCGLSSFAVSARAMMPVGSVICFGASLFSLIAGFGGHALAVLGLVFAFFARHLPADRFEEARFSKWREELTSFGRPFVYMGMCGWLFQSIDRWIAVFGFGEHAGGIFGMASAMAGTVPNFLAAGLMQVVFPGIFRRADLAAKPEDWLELAGRCDRAAGIFWAGTLAGLLGLWWAGPLLVPWLISPRYLQVLSILVPAGMSAASVQVNQFHYLLLQGQHNSRAIVKVMLCLALGKVAGSIIAGMISWSVFLGWLVVSTVAMGIAGRVMIRRMAFPAEVPRT